MRRAAFSRKIRGAVFSLGHAVKGGRNSICAESKVKFVILEKKEICFLSSSKIFDRKWYCN